MSKLENERTYKEKKAQRTREVRRKKNILYAFSITIVLFFIITLCIMISNNPKNAEASECGSYIYTCIQVHEGDTLWSIAEDHIEDYNGSIYQYVEEIADVNQLMDDTIESGSSLMIPVFQSYFR
ncbi:MAG: LysM peptidoglycan-binding domain-containing protein [Lachnospiraceae bacterium]